MSIKTRVEKLEELFKPKKIPKPPRRCTLCPSPNYSPEVWAILKKIYEIEDRMRLRVIYHLGNEDEGIKPLGKDDIEMLIERLGRINKDRINDESDKQLCVEIEDDIKELSRKLKGEK